MPDGQDEDRLFTPRYSAGPMGPAAGRRGGGAEGGSGTHADADGDEGAGSGMMRDGAGLRHRRQGLAPGAPGFSVPGAKASPRARGASRRAIVPVDDEDML